MGTYFLTFVIVLVNAAAAKCIVERRLVTYEVSSTAGCIVLMLAYGAIRLITLPTTKGPNVMLIQPNITLEKKMEGRLDAMKVYYMHMDQTQSALNQVPETDLVVWPETSFRADLNDRQVLGLLENPSRYFNKTFLIGVEVSGTKWYNSGLLFTPKFGLVDQYKKVHLVPFAEYVPTVPPFNTIGSVVRGMSQLQFNPDFTASTEVNVLSLERTTFACLICFETAFSRLVSYSSLKGAKFIVNISNDGWFRDSAELDQILNIAKIRAVESRISILRCTNTGISCFISPKGTIEAILPEKERPGFLAGRVTLTETFSLYRITGDVFPCACLLFILASAIFTKGSRSKQGQESKS
jgi:apolipoprotein N-acyltransferase